MKKRKILPPSNFQDSILHETGYTIWPRAPLAFRLWGWCAAYCAMEADPPHLYPLPSSHYSICSSWRCWAWSYLRAFALLVPSTWTALPPGTSQAFSQRSPSQWFSPPTIWNHNSSLSSSLTHLKYALLFYLLHLIYHHLFYCLPVFSY